MKHPTPCGEENGGVMFICVVVRLGEFFLLLKSVQIKQRWLKRFSEEMVWVVVSSIFFLGPYLGK